MSEPRERELKFKFRSEEAFLLSRAAAALGKRLRVDFLENHYFDTADGTLVSRRVMLRIRRVGHPTLDLKSHFVLGLKIGGEPRPGFFHSLELEERISTAAAGRVLAAPEEIYLLDVLPVRALCDRFEPLRLEALGCLRTERITKDADGRRLEFDRLIFPDDSASFELEIETDEPELVEGWLRGVLVDLGIEVEPQRLTKLEQFVSWKKGRL